MGLKLHVTWRQRVSRSFLRPSFGNTTAFITASCTHYSMVHGERSDEAWAWYSAVYEAVQEIPHGKVTSYGHIARLLGKRRHLLTDSEQLANML